MRDISLKSVDDEKNRPTKAKKEDLQKYQKEGVRNIFSILFKTILWYVVIVIVFFFVFNVFVKSMTITIIDRSTVTYEKNDVSNIDVGFVSFFKEYGGSILCSIVLVWTVLGITSFVSSYKPVDDLQEIKRRVEGQYIIALVTFFIAFVVLKLLFTKFLSNIKIFK